MGRYAWIFVLGGVFAACSSDDGGSDNPASAAGAGGAISGEYPFNGGAGEGGALPAAGAVAPGGAGGIDASGGANAAEEGGGAGEGGAAGASDRAGAGGLADDGSDWSPQCHLPTDGLSCAAKTWKFPVSCGQSAVPPVASCQELVAPLDGKSAWCCSQCLRDAAFDFGSEKPACPQAKPHYQLCAEGTPASSACVAASIPSGGRCCP